MALDNDATLVIGTGHFYRAAAGTPMPADLSAPGSAWTEVGHTSLEDIFSISSDGGDATVLGTLQNKSLRTTYAPRTETFAFTLQQFDEDSLKLYYGANATKGSNGELQIPSDPVPTKDAYLAVFIDGDNHFGIYAPSAEYFRGDDLSLSDTESLAGLPIGVKPLQYQQNKWAYAVTPITPVGTPTVP